MNKLDAKSLIELTELTMPIRLTPTDTTYSVCIGAVAPQKWEDHMTQAAVCMSTEQDHERVMAIPSYRRWYDQRETWQFDYRDAQYAKARQMREAAKAKYDAELERIAEWESEHASASALYEAWSVADKRRYWKLRKV